MAGFYNCKSMTIQVLQSGLWVGPICMGDDLLAGPCMWYCMVKGAFIVIKLNIEISVSVSKIYLFGPFIFTNVKL